MFYVNLSIAFKNMTVQTNLATLIVILGLLNCIKFSHAKNHNCTIQFSKVCQHFLDCAIENAEPVQYCRKCGVAFGSVMDKYNELVANETCKARYFNQDRLHLLEMTYSSTQSLWESGSCSNCYTDGNITKQLSPSTIQFFDDLKGLKNCIQQFHNETVCSNCIRDYDKVNGLYTEIKENTNDNFCFDIKDAMNKTRLNWSHTLKCCNDRKTSLTAFIVSSVIIGVFVPFAFYTGFMFFGWRREQLHDPLLDSDTEPAAGRQLAEREEVRVVAAVTNLLALNS